MSGKLICYTPKRFGSSALRIIEQANSIIDEYVAQGFMLTLRQLFYQFVSKDLIPNKVAEYKRLGAIVNDAKLAGLIPWDAIEDRTRNVKEVSTWDSPSSIIEAVSRQYKTDLWESQNFYVEVWIEKDALVGVIERVCEEWRVPYFACRGYVSGSELWGASERIGTKTSDGKEAIILHLGDHDPSGIDMTRDNQARFDLFLPENVRVKRLALNMNQVQQYNPPPNPAKATDARFEGYKAAFGDECWELDALKPTVISKLVGDNIKTLIDMKLWKVAKPKKMRSVRPWSQYRPIGMKSPSAMGHNARKNK